MSVLSLRTPRAVLTLCAVAGACLAPLSPAVAAMR